MSETLKRTALFDTHKKLGAKTVPFGGWDMPVWYTSVKDEHAAVRNAAGLFDVTHMGVLEASGPNACAFLDAVSSNDVSKLAVGRSQYGYLFDDNADVIDDIMIYRLAAEQYMVVVNASNNDKVWAWLTSANGNRTVQCNLRDLRAASSGDDCRVDLALQGPKSLEILQALNPQLSNLSALPYTGVMHASLGELDVIISRTGYTGERVAYELFVHPAQSVALWQKLLDAGKGLGLKPCGLAARDSLRTEAGLPLYGHELGGQLNLVPCQIGFDNFVKLNKIADFIGKAAYAAKVAANNSKLVRFRMNDKGVRVSKLGDPIVDKRGRVIGTITSCALDSDGFLLGLALVENGANVAEGASLGVIVLPERMPPALTPFAALGSRTLVPDSATIISRFPPRKS
ncbi:MAG: glycine cleavage system aminomethyltransferase GcvT [Anaerolineae bacterium]|nr:glycine cleavage system aminomethyltransferase GcvT [Anaerolineae bacterium]